MSTATQGFGEVSKPRSRFWEWMPEITTALAAFIVYARSFGFNFAFDDVAIIVHNVTVQSWRYFPDYFTRDLWQNVQTATGYYRPLVLLWFRLNFVAFGINPAWWHFTNVLAHAAAAVLVLRMALRVSGNHSLAWIAGILFAVHPVHVETVAWISDVVDALLTVFFVGGVLCFLRWRGGSRKWLVASIACYCGAMLSKEPGFTLPGVLFVCVLALESSAWKKRMIDATVAVLWYLPFSVLYLLARHHALRGFSVQLQQMSVPSWLLTLPMVLWEYSRMLLVPVGLSPFYELPTVYTVSWSAFFSPLLGVFAIAALLVVLSRKMDVATRQLTWLGLGWSLITLAPALDLPAFPQSEMVHDRYIYLASVGICLVAAAILMQLEARLSIVITVTCVLALAALTVRQQAFWRDDITMFSRGVEIAPHNDNAESGLATLVARHGDYPLAISLYSDVLKRNPTQLNANLNLGWTYFLTGDYEKAEKYLTVAATHNSTTVDCFLDLGVLYLKTGRLDLALASLRRAESFSAPRPVIQEKISEVLEQQGDILGAVQEMLIAVRLAPENQQYAARLEALQAKLH
jgi:Tfp pilus assembly protein PilF